MDNPLVSVIVPIYNVEEYLNSCVESIINQTYRNLEIILVDDGSPDKCPQICDKWAEKDKRIKVIHKKNGGLSDARNAGLKIAEGKYISFIDSDDLVDKRFIQVLFSAIDETGAGLSACDVEEFSDEKALDLIEDSSFQLTSANAEQALSQLIRGRGFRAVAWNKLYSRGLLENEEFEYGRLHEDEFFTYRIIDKCKKLSYIDLPLYKYRQREGSIMKVVSDKHLDALDAGFQRLKLLKIKYPELYKTDKITFCGCCLSTYSQAARGMYESNKKAMEKVKLFRKQIKFSLSEFIKGNVKCKYFIVASNTFFIDLFSRLRK